MTSPAQARPVAARSLPPENAHGAAADDYGAARGHTPPPESDSGAILAHIAQLHAELALAYRELAETLPNRLDVGPSLSPGVGVGALPATRSIACDFLTVRDVAERLQVDVKTVRRWRHEGKLPRAFSNGSIIRWQSEDIDAWIEEQTR